jgi:hypothetical protein
MRLCPYFNPERIASFLIAGICIPWEICDLCQVSIIMKDKLHTPFLRLALIAGIKQSAARAAKAFPIAAIAAATRVAAQTFMNLNSFLSVT